MYSHSFRLKLPLCAIFVHQYDTVIRPLYFFHFLFFYRLLTVYALFLTIIAFFFRFTSFLMPFLLLSFHNVTFLISYIIFFFCYLYTYLWVSYSIWMHIFFTSTSNITLIFFFLFSTHETIFYTYFLTYCFHYEFLLIIFLLLHN